MPDGWRGSVVESGWRWPHMLAAMLISASFFVAGISAWYLAKGRAKGFARRSMPIVFGIAALLMRVQLWFGDSAVRHELPHQLSKLEATEGNWDNGDTGFVLFSPQWNWNALGPVPKAARRPRLGRPNSLRTRPSSRPSGWAEDRSLKCTESSKALLISLPVSLGSLAFDARSFRSPPRESN